MKKDTLKDLDKMEQEKKIRVLHFDHERALSRGFREDLKEEFEKHKEEIDYQDYMKDHCGNFEQNRNKLESLLPEKDVLLIHPGFQGQKVVFEYPKIFPNLEVVLVIPGDGELYNHNNEIELFNYNHKESILDYVLDFYKRKEK